MVISVLVTDSFHTCPSPSVRRGERSRVLQAHASSLSLYRPSFNHVNPSGRSSRTACRFSTRPRPCSPNEGKSVSQVKLSATLAFRRHGRRRTATGPRRSMSGSSVSRRNNPVSTATETQLTSERAEGALTSLTSLGWYPVPTARTAAPEARPESDPAGASSTTRPAEEVEIRCRPVS